MEKRLLEDLLVIDCASFIAGLAAATIMSDFGARVIKIEPPVIGDSYRQLMNVPGMPTADHDYFWTLDNRNKESLALDLKHPGARDWSEWKPLFQQAGITFGPIAQPSDHLECPQVAANGFLPEIEDAGGLRTVDSPIRVAGEVKRRSGKAPAIGEHTRGILSGIGMDEAAIDAMIASGAAAE